MEPIKKTIPYLKIGLICLLVIYCFRSVSGQISRARELPDTDGPFFAEWEKRFEPIKEALPFAYGVIGYAADWDIPGLEYDPANTEAEHVLTQYALSPIVVSRDTSREWVIANMTAADFEAWFGLQEGEFEVTRYRYNLYLVHRLK